MFGLCEYNWTARWKMMDGTHRSQLICKCHWITYIKLRSVTAPSHTTARHTCTFGLSWTCTMTTIRLRAQLYTSKIDDTFHMTLMTQFLNTITAQVLPNIDDTVYTEDWWHSIYDIDNTVYIWHWWDSLYITLMTQFIHNIDDTVYTKHRWHSLYRTLMKQYKIIWHLWHSLYITLMTQFLHNIDYNPWSNWLVMCSRQCTIV